MCSVCWNPRERLGGYVRTRLIRLEQCDCVLLEMLVSNELIRYVLEREVL